MGEFDDVLAMEPGDEWDDHVIGGPLDADETHGPLQVTLRLPNAVVELRGDTPSSVIDTLGDLTDERLELPGDAPTATVSVRRDGEVWILSGDGGTTTVQGTSDDLLRSVVARLGRLAVDTDPLRLHLDVAAVRRGEHGIVIVDAHTDALDGNVVHIGSGSDPGSSSSPRDDRALVVADLLELGADYVTADLLSLLPGSRTVFGHPSPPATSTHPPVRASTVAGVSPFTQVGQVIVLRHVPGSAATAIELDVASAAVQLVLSARDLDRIGPAALDVVAHTIGGAHCAVVEYSDPRDVAALIADLPSSVPRRVTVAHRFDRSDTLAADSTASGGAPVSTAIRRGQASLRLARFDTSGALYDGATGVLTTLTTPEIDALESLLVRPVKTSSKGATGAAVAALARLASAGVQIPVGTERTAPGLDAFGLPNCPVGVTAAEMWSSDTALRMLAEASAPGADVAGAVAQAVERGVATPPRSEQGAILDRHELARRLVATIESTLHQVLDVAAQHSIVPIVLGSGVLAHDGPLPADFTDAEQVDLLVDPADLAVLLRALVASGFEQVIPPPTDGPDLPVAHEVVRPGDVPVTVQLRTRLAVGPFAALVNHEELHDRSVPAWIGTRWCRALHPEDRFVFTCVQLDLDTSHSTVQDLRDVVLSAPRIEANMAQALEASERWGSTLSTLASLQRVNAVMPGLSPWLVERAERTDRSRRRQEKAERPSRGLRRRRN